MEYLLLGGLAYAGQQYAKRNTPILTGTSLNEDPRKDNQPRSPFIPESVPNSTQLSVEKVQTDMMKQMTRHVNDPNTVNIVEPSVNNNLPFFKSERSQNTNDALKDRRLSTFTGVDTMDFRHKKEVEAPKPLRSLSNVHGSHRIVDKERYQPTMSLKHNDIPFEQVKVGPGIGLKSDEVASGGFHQNVRILPGNVNGYRKHNFEGRVVTGKAGIDHTESKIKVDVTKRTPIKETFRGLGCPQSSIQATSARSTEVFRDTRRGSELNMTTNTKGTVSTYVTQRPTRTGQVSESTDYYGNPQAERVGLIPESSYVIQETERGDVNAQRLNATGATHGTGPPVASAYDIATQREMHANDPANTTSANATAAAVVRDGYAAKPTQKLLEGNHVGGASRVIGNYTGLSEAKPTLRGTSSGHLLAGPSKSTVSSNRSYKQVYEGSRQVTKREDTVIKDYVPNFGVQTQSMDPNTVLGRLREETPGAGNVFSSVISNGLNIPFMTGAQSVRNGDNTNTRDFGFAPSVLSSNEFAIDIRSKFT